MPVTTITAPEQSAYEDGFNDRWTDLIREDIRESEGMPVCVSVISRPYQDEVALAIMKQIESAIDFKCVPKSVKEEIGIK